MLSKPGFSGHVSCGLCEQVNGETFDTPNHQPFVPTRPIDSVRPFNTAFVKIARPSNIFHFVAATTIRLVYDADFRIDCFGFCLYWNETSDGAGTPFESSGLLLYPLVSERGVEEEGNNGIGSVHQRNYEDR
jgi:hypothetical protein